ncbi:MAG: addiction module protein [Pseudomonadota bacterium]
MGLVLQSPACHEIEEQAKKLPLEERACLAESLLESLRPEGLAEVEAAWELKPVPNNQRKKDHLM